MGEARIDTAFVDEWSAKYPPQADNHVLNVVHQSVADRGHYSREDADAVVRWKSKRTIGYLSRNEPGDIEKVSGWALSGPKHLAHLVLGVLHGVQEPVASALLTIAKPDEFTVIDRYAIHALRHHCEWADKQRWPDYATYVRLCDTIARRCNTDLRTLDRALWAWGDVNRR